MGFPRRTVKHRLSDVAYAVHRQVLTSCDQVSPNDHSARPSCAVIADCVALRRDWGSNGARSGYRRWNVGDSERCGIVFRFASTVPTPAAPAADCARLAELAGRMTLAP